MTVTLKLASVHGPNEVPIATSMASRPRAIRMRPMRGLLWRESNVYQRPAEIDLEIHRRIVERNADVTEIAGTGPVMSASTVGLIGSLGFRIAPKPSAA
jgi:hypothetical protein